MRNNNLSAARRNKNDEFYTLLPDIENELKWYKDYFKDKVVYCNCDDPDRSNFVKFFIAKFQNYGLKKLIATHYVEGAAVSHKLEVTENGTSLTEIDGDGSYCSEPCLTALQEADIVVTNPPFSLFREYVAKLYELKKQFLIIGSMNAITYKEIFPLIKENKLWLGINNVKKFLQPNNSFKTFGNICWFTNLQHYKRNATVLLYKEYSPQVYQSYDNSNILEVSKVKDIPIDYQGLMGVPITFLNKYSPSQFDILGLANNVRSIGYDCKTIINGRPVYNRIIIKHREISNED